MDLEQRREIQEHVTNYVCEKKDKSSAEILKLVKGPSATADTLHAVLDSLLHRLRGKTTGERIRVIQLLSLLSTESEGFSWIVADGIPRIARWTLLDHVTSTALKDETTEFLTEWYAGNAASPQVKSAARYLRMKVGLALDLTAGENGSVQKPLSEVVREVDDVLLEMERCFEILVPRFDVATGPSHMSSGAPGSTVPPEKIEAVLESADDQVLERFTRESSGGHFGAEDHHEDIDVDISVEVDGEDKEPIFATVRDRLRILDNSEDALRSLQNSSVTASDRSLIEACLEKIDVIKTKSERFGIEADLDDWEDVELESRLLETSQLQATPSIPLSDRIGDVGNVDGINAAVLKAVGATIPEKRGRGKRGRKSASGMKRSLSPKSRIRAKLKRAYQRNK